MGPIGCSETSGDNYHSTLCNIPEERRSRIVRGGILQSRKQLCPWRCVNAARCLSQSCLKIDCTGSRLTIRGLEIVVKYINCAEGLLCPDGHFGTSLTLWYVYCTLCLTSGLWFRVVTRGQVIISRGLSASLYGSSHISCVIANCRRYYYYHHHHHYCYLNCQNWSFPVVYIEHHVHLCQQKSIGLKFSKSQTVSDVRYSCHHNSSCFTFPIFAHSCRFSVLHSLQSITPRTY